MKHSECLRRRRTKPLLNFKGETYWIDIAHVLRLNNLPRKLIAGIGLQILCADSWRKGSDFPLSAALRGLWKGAICSEAGRTAKFCIPSQPRISVYRFSSLSFLCGRKKTSFLTTELLNVLQWKAKPWSKTNRNVTWDARKARCRQHFDMMTNLESSSPLCASVSLDAC